MNIVKSNADPRTGVFELVTATPSSRFDPAFNSSLMVFEYGRQNHQLILVLKVFLNRVDTGLLPFSLVKDFNKKWFVISRWPEIEWQRFRNRYMALADSWNKQFWLLPPDGWSTLDRKVGAQTLRPCVNCHLFVEFVDSPGAAHASMDVVYLDPKLTAATRHLAPASLGSGTFRSDSGHYDSLDVESRRETSVDDQGVQHTQAKYQTIVHEIGHVLGLPHVGVAHGDPSCKLAIVVDQLFTSFGRPVPALISGLRGGSNSRACYGNWAPSGRAANVMGGGTSFDETNAEPWRKRMGLHTGTALNAWKVSLQPVVAKPV